MCADCNGLGTRMEVDPELVVPDPSLSIARGRDRAVGRRAGARRGLDRRIVDALSPSCDIDLDTPWKKLRRAQREVILYGAGRQARHGDVGRASTAAAPGRMRFEGVVNS